MPKSKNSTVLACDICDFRATNPYIFKRHLHRCLSLHGIASKRSSPRNPIRLKGTEGLLSKEHSFEDGRDVHYNQEATPREVEEGQTTDNNHVSLEALEETSTDSPVAQTDPPEESQIDMDKSSDYTSEEQNMSMDASPVETPGMEKSTSGDGALPGAPYSRQYTCSECDYNGKSARDYLYHLRDFHGHKFKIHECHICDYATRYGNKVERHMSVHNKLIINMDDQGRREKAMENVLSFESMEGETTEVAGEQFETSKIQPLKLKRVNVKMPFKITGPTEMGEGSMFTFKRSRMTQATEDSSVMKIGFAPYKDVYRMVLTEDGAHHYQCRDCLYYASIPSNVKKHHALCHTRMLCCPHCSLTTMSQGIYYEHLITHEGHGYMKCPDCSYVTSAKSNYEKHRSFHNGNFPAQCTVCNFGAESESKIKRHVATQHTPVYDPGEEVEKPEEGVQMDISQFGWYKEAKGAGEDGSFAPSGSTAVGQANDPSGKQPTGEEYKCTLCPMICFRRGNFTRHLMTKHSLTTAKATSLSKCMESQMFKGLKRKKWSGNALVEYKKMRLQSSENLKCSHCSYIAKWPSDLRRHMQVHTIVKRFRCTVCANKYKYLGDLNVHMRRDHNMEPPVSAVREITTLEGLKKASPALFRCPICPFTSHSKADLEQHSRAHGNIQKTYQCRSCEYQTYWRGDVGRHLFRHHKIILSKEGTEIGEYFIHRPEIKPLYKQGVPLRHCSLSPSPSPDQVPGGAEFAKEGTPDSIHSSSSRKTSTSSSVNLKDGNFVCEYPNCEFKTTISDRMESHLAVHLNLKQYVCPTCGKRTNWKWDVVKHMVKVHQNTTAAIEDVITLSVDEARATIKNYLMHFEKKPKDLTVSCCSLCDFKSFERNRVVRHMGSDHKNENGKVISRAMASPEDFETVQGFAHDREIAISADGDQKEGLDSDEPSVPVPKFAEPTAEELAKYDKPYACAICRKPGTSKGDVKKHYNYTHPYKDVRILYVGDGTEFNYYTGEIYLKSAKSEQSPSQSFSDARSLLPPLSPAGKLRVDSKFSNPKMHGYVKPFKCSICGLRSNWKWDLKKHLRSKHANEGGFVIMLSIEEAAETYGRDCTPSHPKNEDFLSILKSSPSPIPFLSPTNPSPLPVFKPPPVIKSETVDNCNSRDSFTSSFFPKSPASSTSLSPKSGSRDRSTFIDPTRRQWKCSVCNYISNWRRNMARHIHRKHSGQEGKVKIVPLHKDGPDLTYKQNLMDKFVTQSNNSSNIENDTSVKWKFGDSTQRKPASQSEMKLWRCPECPFTSRLRTHIIIHMQQHEMKPFTCGVCNVPFKNRGPLHRHLQKIHKRSDYIKLCKVNIHYDDADAEATVENQPLKEEYCYFCRLCNLQSERREEITRHLKDAHSTLESDNNILKIQKHSGHLPSKKKASLPGYSKADSQKLNRKFHFCTICPYRSQKKAMLAFHMTYHKPNPANRFKCKHCPYYVSTLRLLHQHQRKWHKEASGKMSWEQEEQITPSVSPSKLFCGNSSSITTPRRHCCEKCPYTTNSKNDFIYHKQFHRPKRTAEFKCEYCDYWVVHKRLLKQHMRLHTDSPGIDCSPAKSLYSDPGLVYDPVELAELAAIKQKMISAKITASLSKSPNISPMKLASQCTVDDKPNFVLKNGLYRKLHKCRHCPYTNIRARNMQLHEMMHGPRDSPHPLMKCPYCDYYVGSKGLLSHHMKVHQKNYGDTPENDSEFGELGDGLDNDDESDEDILPQQKVDTLLQISRFKRFGCERCPFASARRQAFERHLELHGSRQRYTCQYCDYSVPSNNLLYQHIRLHMMPNQNLLASQSITNLQHLCEVPADVALASALPPADSDTTVTISVIHDHLALYENSIYDPEPKKLYRCDRCPYANVRRDYLLSHLKFHMVSSALVCPYCDYSAPKQALLTQHIRVHFCPLPELSDWLLENGQTERETGHKNLDLAEALKVAHEYQNQSKKKDKGKSTAAAAHADKVASAKEDKPEGKENIQTTGTGDGSLTYICQYCDREFQASDKLVKHELQHLIGNHFEASVQAVAAQQQARDKKEVKSKDSKTASDSLAGPSPWEKAPVSVSPSKTDQVIKQESQKPGQHSKGEIRHEEERNGEEKEKDDKIVDADSQQENVMIVDSEKEGGNCAVIEGEGLDTEAPQTNDAKHELTLGSAQQTEAVSKVELFSKEANVEAEAPQTNDAKHELTLGSLQQTEAVSKVEASVEAVTEIATSDEVETEIATSDEAETDRIAEAPENKINCDDTKTEAATDKFNFDDAKAKAAIGSCTNTKTKAITDSLMFEVVSDDDDDKNLDAVLGDAVFKEATQDEKLQLGSDGARLLETLQVRETEVTKDVTACAIAELSQVPLLEGKSELLPESVEQEMDTQECTTSGNPECENITHEKKDDAAKGDLAKLEITPAVAETKEESSTEEADMKVATEVKDVDAGGPKGENEASKVAEAVAATREDLSEVPEEASWTPARPVGTSVAQQDMVPSPASSDGSIDDVKLLEEDDNATIIAECDVHNNFEDVEEDLLAEEAEGERSKTEGDEEDTDTESQSMKVEELTT